LGQAEGFPGDGPRGLGHRCVWLHGTLEPATHRKDSTEHGFLKAVVTRADGTTTSYHPADAVRAWAELAAIDPAVARALGLMAAGDWGWVNLYRLFEVVADDVGGDDAVAARGWATKAAIRLFKHTANHPDAAGAARRDESGTASAPDGPAGRRGLSEGGCLVVAAVEGWIALNPALAVPPPTDPSPPALVRTSFRRQATPARPVSIRRPRRRFSEALGEP
jgi:hypothetical protein